MKIPVKILDPEIPLPVYEHPGEDAGMDLRSRISCILNPGEFKKIPTGIAMAIPQGYVGYVNPRSGLAAKHGITVLNADGVIDSGFRGEINVILINHGKELFKIVKGHRIAQLIIHKVIEAEWEQVENLPPSGRKEKGFGQTGRS